MSMLHVSSRSWHGRIYLWWYKAKYAWVPVGVSTNLCHYMRVVLVFALLRGLFLTWRWSRSLAWAFVVGASAFCLASLLGYSTYISILWAVAFCLSAVAFWAVVISAGVGIGAGIGWLEDNRGLANVEDFIPATFRKLCRARVQAWHERICPLVTIK